MADKPLDVELLEEALASGNGGLLTRLDYGTIALPSGQLIVDDPGTHEGKREATSLPPGTYPVAVLINGLTWAYAVIVVADAEPVAWQRLGHVPVDTGTACFMSREMSDAFCAWRPAGSDLLKELWEPFNAATKGPNYMHTYASKPPPKSFHLRVDDDPSHAIPIFHAGVGDGRYGYFLGLDRAGAPCRLVLDFGVGAREDDVVDDDDDDEPATSRPELPPEDAGFLALGIDEVEDEPEHDTPAMERARERHNAGNDVYDKPAKLACYYEALGCLRGTTVPFPELLLDIAVCHKGYPRDPAPRPFAEAAAVRFERRARRSKAGADSLFQLARAYALAGRQPAMIQALKQWIPLHASNAGKVKETREFDDYKDDRDLMALIALARRGRR